MKNKKQANKRGHIRAEERFTIEKMLNAGKEQKEIAKVLERGVSTVSEEIKRGMVNGVYIAKKAHHKAYVRQYNKKKDCLKVSMDTALYNHAEKRLKEGVSPEEISAETQSSKTLQYASGKALRKFVHTRRPDLERYLFWNRNNKKSGKKNKKGTYLNDPGRVWIEQRHEDFYLYDLEYGHWEADFIVSTCNAYVLLVLVERSSKYTLIDILPNRKNTLVNERIESLLKHYMVKSLTLDNDIAFRKWRELSQRLSCPIYFTHPYHSWEKGLVENTNRWIREFVPKKSDISKLSKQYVMTIQNWLNNKPRVILDGHTASAIMALEGENVVPSPLLFPSKNSYLGVR